MSTIQNIKNLIRHGKQARVTCAMVDSTPCSQLQLQQHQHQQPHLQPLQHQQHLYQQRHQHQPRNAIGINGCAKMCKDDQILYTSSDCQRKGSQPDANSATSTMKSDGGQHPQPHSSGDISCSGSLSSVASIEQSLAEQTLLDPTVVERIVAEEREMHDKLPTYPGLERYVLLEKMGDGAFSNVYRARDSTNEFGEVAVKVVRKFELNGAQRASVLKEVQIMRNLDHPNIVKLLDFSDSTQYYFIILELCVGGELFHEIVRLTYFSEKLSRHVIVQVAQALNYMHEKAGVVHRDIKPENLLFFPIPFIPSKEVKAQKVGEEEKLDEGEFTPGIGGGGIGRIKVADFGLSKIIWDRDTMTPCGTVGYTAPEIVKDERYSKSVDMWALGCVLYTLLCGFPPFYDESIQTLSEKVAKGQYTFLSPWWDDISSEAKDLVSHLLTVDPEERYDISQFLNHPWILATNESSSAILAAKSSSTVHNETGIKPCRTPDNWVTSSQFIHDSTCPSTLAAPISTSSAPDVSGTGPAQLSDTGRVFDFRSPGIFSLREIFDISYAVHRKEEEGKRRRNLNMMSRGLGFLMSSRDDNGTVPVEASTSGSVSTVAAIKSNLGDGEEGENLEDHHNDNEYAQSGSGVGVSKESTCVTVTNDCKNKNSNGNSNEAGINEGTSGGFSMHTQFNAAAQKLFKNRSSLFELSLDNATLLGRRSKKVRESGLRNQVVAVPR